VASTDTVDLTEDDASESPGPLTYRVRRPLGPQDRIVVEVIEEDLPPADAPHLHLLPPLAVPADTRNQIWAAFANSYSRRMGEEVVGKVWLCRAGIHRLWSVRLQQRFH
jgi:hypothetical protein